MGIDANLGSCCRLTNAVAQKSDLSAGSTAHDTNRSRTDPWTLEPTTHRIVEVADNALVNNSAAKGVLADAEAELLFMSTLSLPQNGHLADHPLSPVYTSSLDCRVELIPPHASDISAGPQHSRNTPIRVAPGDSIRAGHNDPDLFAAVGTIRCYKDTFWHFLFLKLLTGQLPYHQCSGNCPGNVK